MCLCMEDECKVKSHQKVRVLLTRFPSSCFLLVGRGVNLSWGYLNLTLDATNLELSLISSLLGQVNED